MAVAKNIKQFGQYLSALLMLAVTALMTLQVVARYIFNSPIDWSEEVCRILFVAMIFVGAISADHIRVDVIPKKILDKIQNYLNLIILLLHTAYFVGVIVIFAVFQRPINVFSTPLLEIPMFYLLAIAPLCFALILIREWAEFKNRS